MTITLEKDSHNLENILSHGFDLQRIYPDSNQFGPVTLCKKLYRYEVEASRITKQICSYPIDMDKAEKRLDKIEAKVNDILGAGPEVFINRDPRGYALKIKTEAAKGLDIYKDWGGYGIICPEF